MGQEISRSVVLQTIAPIVATDFAIQMACFIVAAFLQTEKFYDFSGSVTFITCTLISLYWRRFLHPYLLGAVPLSPSAIPPLSSFHPRQLLASGTTIIWAVRLGTFLLNRIINSGKDSRFDNIKTKPAVFFIYWFIQAVWIGLTALPVYLVNAVPAEAQPPLEMLDFVGCVIWGIGFLIELTADLQKSAWKSRKENKGKFIKEGLWSISRHPNYFGECLLWAGSWLSAASGLVRVSDPRIISPTAARLTIASPLFVIYLITQVSGIPPLERSSDKKFGNLAEYQEYKRRTSVFVPWWAPKV
ncbi:hypothetical protein BC937DRAFT_90654 [Endogone sp. FLAS-F59071]|nr:hypothetical protein BC937DRAFT_90654 [Endogone sp. FLAS-F59071]|eukprot:RUS16916.1 hypothetical protein BC937DRAFT_90654 [Endogone sp. FLAS-F59071]